MSLTAALEIALAAPVDANGIAECFRDAYAGTYPLADFLDPNKLGARIASGRTIFAVALEGSAVVAAVALEPVPGSRTGDFGHGVVRRSHRGLGLFRELHVPLLARARDLGLSTVHSQCVTSHQQSQKPMLELGGRIAGLTLAAAPRDLRFAGLRDRLVQRESFLDHCFVLGPRACAEVHAPRSLADAVARAYDSLGLSYRLRDRGPESPLTFVLRRNAELGTVTLDFADRGGAGSRPLASTLDELAPFECVYARLPLRSRATATAAEALRDLGFSFAAVLPGRAPGDSDALSLQRPRDVLAAGPIEVVSDSGRRIKQLVFEDLAAVRSCVLA